MARIGERVVGEKLKLVEEVAQACAIVILDVGSSMADVRGRCAAHACVGIDANDKHSRGPPGAQSHRSA
eukprot:1583266-Heterocapsa_arctica.AAC.1